MNGYVYILANSAIPNLIKIGRTTKDPKERASELSGTGTPGKFIVIYSVYVTDCVFLEKEIHNHFSEQRHSNDREFFEIEPVIAIDKLIELSEFYQINESLKKDTKSSTLDFLGQLKNIGDDSQEYSTDLSEKPNDIEVLYFVEFYLAKINNYIFRFGFSCSEKNDNVDSEICERIKKYLKELGVQENHFPTIIKSVDFKIYGDCKEFLSSLFEKNIQNFFSDNFSYPGFNKKHYKLIYDQFTIFNFTFHTIECGQFLRQFNILAEEIKKFELKRKNIYDKIQEEQEIENKKIEIEKDYLKIMSLKNKFNI